MKALDRAAEPLSLLHGPCADPASQINETVYLKYYDESQTHVPTDSAPALNSFVNQFI